jgi:hypothetical protein
MRRSTTNEGRDIDEATMTHTLQELFIRSKGQPLTVGNSIVSQLCEIPLRRGVVRFQFISPPDSNQGVCAKAKGGEIVLSDGSSTEVLYIWHEPGLPNTVSHRVWCPAGQLLVWNIYRVHHHRTGEVTEDYWTGNAGMVLAEDRPGHRRYCCSDWRTPFVPNALVFDVDWTSDDKP